MSHSRIVREVLAKHERHRKATAPTQPIQLASEAKITECLASKQQRAYEAVLADPPLAHALISALRDMLDGLDLCGWPLSMNEAVINARFAIDRARNGGRP